MATSPDGILEAAFDRARNLTRLVVDGGMWPVPGVQRTNYVINPKPVGTSWAAGPSSATTAAIVTDDGAPCLEVTVTDTAVSVYVYVAQNVTPAPGIGRWVAFGVDVKPLTAPAAAAMRTLVRLQSGTVTTQQQYSALPEGGWVAGQWRRSVVSVQQTSEADNVDALTWPTGTHALGPLYRARRAVIAFADTQAEAEAAVAAFFDGDTPPSGSVIRYWTGAPNASSSVEELVTGPVSRVLIERSSPGVPTEPVRTANGAPAAGGWFLGADDAAPMDTTCTYMVSGLDQYGGVVATSSLAVETTGAAWGPWLKAPGRPQFTVQVPLAQVGDVASSTQGAMYQVPGGGSVPQWSGTDTDVLTVTLLPRDDREVERLMALLREERTLLIQTGDPGEPLLPSGYYFASGVGRSNPTQVRRDVYGRRVFVLQLTATSAPVGEGQGFTGTTYETVRQTYATYQDVVDGNATYFDVYAGEGV